MATNKVTTKVEITAEDKATQKVKELDERLDKLTSEDREAVLKARADDLEKTVKDSLKKLAQVDGEEFTALVDAKDLASAELRQIRAKLSQIDGERVEATVDVDTAPARKSLGSLSESLSELDGPLGDIGSKLEGLAGGNAATVGVGALVTGLALAADEAADLAIEADNLAKLTGDSVEYASALNGVWKTTGADAKDLQDVLLQMNGVLSTNADIAKTLGVNLDDGATVGQRFEQVAEALDKIPDAARRSQIASQVFGEEGVRQYNALRNSVDDISEAIDNYQGKTFSSTDVEDARKYKAELAKVKQQFADLSAEVGSGLLPALTETLSVLNDITDWRPPGLGTDLGSAVARGLKGILAGSGNPIADWVKDDMETARAEAEARVDPITDPVIDGWNRVIDNAKDVADQGGVTSDVLEMQADYAEVAAAMTEALADADERAAEEAEKAATAHDLKVRAMESELRAAEDLYEQTLLNIGGDIAVRQSKRNAEKAVEDYAAVIADEESTLRDAAEAQDAAVEAQLDAAEAAVRYAEDQAAANGKTLDAKEKAAIYRGALEDLVAQLDGPIAEAIRGYIAELDKIPATKTTKVVLEGGGAVTVDPSGRKRGGRSGADSFTQSSPGSQARGTQAPSGVTINVYPGILVGSKAELGRVVQEALSEWQRRGGR